MGKKLMQVTDSIHGTIYLSELESELISTPFFYRLHDIYQSSTVYMTFPSNRTKRYEHSLGTMSLASRLLYSSVTNAEKETKDQLFKKLKKYFLDVSKKVFLAESESLYFAQGNVERISNLFDQIQKKGKIDVILWVRNAIKNRTFNDKSLEYYQYYPIECITDRENIDTENIFLYKCLLQAVRIVALFHDVGHPPYSHIIEDVLKDLYHTVGSNNSDEWIETKIIEFKKVLDPYFSKEQRRAYKCKRLISKSSLIDSAPHERIGLSFLDYAINEVIPKKLSIIASTNEDNTERFIQILYYITIVEFAFAILTEINPFFKSFHKIVDGVLDADRLDYIVRDSQNSGVDWGKIPYERIINSAKLHYLEKDNSGRVLSNNKRVFVVAFPQKITDDIEDLLLVRYKIFARINFHHRCIKTSMALQGAIRYLAIDYLKHEDDCINDEISNLWLSISNGMGDKRIRTIQWNDSWLISVLNDALVHLHLYNNDDFRPNIRILKENLEEILLNKRTYFSLLKRGRDNSNFVKSILEKTSITKDMLVLLQEDEYKKYIDNKSNTDHELLNNEKLDALDSIKRISSIFERLDLEELCEFIPLKGVDLKEIVDQRLDTVSEISNYATVINYGRSKNGLSKHEDVLDGIYLYKNDDIDLFNEDFSLYSQIDAVTKNIPWLYVYFVPKDENTSIEQISSSILNILASGVAEKLKQRFIELFPSTKLILSDK